MKTIVYVNASYWNDKIEKVKVEKIYTKYFNITESFSSLLQKLRIDILKNKDDGFHIDIYKYDETAFIKIELYFGESDINIELNTDYVKQFFDPYNETNSLTVPGNEKVSQNYLYVYANENIELLLRDILNKDNDAKFQKKYHVYERGASDFYTAFILSFTSGATLEIIKNLIKVKYPEISMRMDSISKDELEPIEEFLYEHEKLSRNHLKLKRFNKFEDIIEVDYLTTRKELIKIKWNSKDGLIEMKKEKID